MALRAISREAPTPCTSCCQGARPPVFASSTLIQLQCRDPEVLGRGHFSSQTASGASPCLALTLMQGALQLDQLSLVQEHPGEALDGMAYRAAVLGTGELNLVH